jgi:type I restriction enzyme S subunit
MATKAPKSTSSTPTTLTPTLSLEGRGGEHRWPRYGSYKDSGIEWLGEVPEHWEVNRLKFLISELESGNRETGGGNQLDDGVFSIGGEHIGWDGKLFFDSPKFISEDFYKKLKKGKIKPRDVILVKDGATIGKTAYVTDIPFGKCAVNEHVFILRAINQIFPKFLYYLIVSKLGFEQIYIQISGAAQPGLNSSFINTVTFSFPSKAEQHAIANFLDQQTAKIDALIAKKQRLIELLGEKRTALISQAVTKGLDPNVPMKDSGLEWLGEIPEHWEVGRNKRIFSEVNELSETGDEELLTVSHITGVTPRSEKEVFMFMAESLGGYKKCQQGDLIINTMWAWMGALGCSTLNGIVSPSYNVYRLRRNVKLSPIYIDYLYRTPKHILEINRYSKGVWSSRLRLYPDEFFLMYTPLPPYEEQLNIIRYLDQETKKIDKLIDITHHAIEKLQEYRTALISAAVTGKIDVRGVAPSPQPSPFQGEGVGQVD